MVYAPRAQQLQLLEVANFDAQINKLRAEIKNAPQHAELLVAKQNIAALKQTLAELNEQRANELELIQNKDTEVEKITAVITGKKTRLQAGVGMDSRELLVLQSEITTVQDKLNAVEEEILESYEKVENLDNCIARTQQDLGDAQCLEQELQATLAKFSADKTGKIEELITQREKIYAPLEAGLKTAYENAKQTGGISIIGLYKSGASTGGIEFSPIEVAAIKAHNPDEIYLSEEYECIVVLLDE